MKFYLKILLFFITVSVTPFITFSQEDKIIDITGKTLENKVPLGNVDIVVYKGTAKDTALTSSNDGSFKFTLLINNKYTVTATKKGFITKKVIFNTTVKTDTFNSEYNFTIILDKIAYGMKLSTFEEPSAIILYNEEREMFDYDKVYAKVIKLKQDSVINKFKKQNEEFREDVVNVAGKATEKNIPLNEVEITLYKGTKKDTTLITSTNGKFDLKLVINNNYTIVATKPGFVDKKILFNTTVKDLNFNDEYGFTLVMVRKNKELDVNSLDKPFAKISYNEEFERFEYDAEYTKIVKSKQDSIVNKANLIVDAKYNEAIVKADNFFKTKNYTDALTFYNNAADINTAATYPKKRITECNNIINKNNLLLVEKLEKEKQAKLAREKDKQDSITKVKLEQERLAKLARDKAITDSLNKVKLEQERLAKLAREKHKQDSINLVKIEQERIAKLNKEKFKQDSINKVKIEQERLAKLSKEKHKQDSINLAKLEKERIAKLAREKLVTDSLNKVKIENERLANLKLEKEKQLKLEREKRKQDSLAMVKLEEEKIRLANLLNEQIKKDSLAKVKIEQERIAKLNKEKFKQDSLNKVKLEQERITKLEKIKQDSIAKVKLEQERLAKLNKNKQDSLAKIKLEQERIAKLNKEKFKQDSLNKVKLEQERLAKLEKIKQDSLANVKIEQEKLAKLKLEQERIAKLNKEKFKQDSLAKVKTEQEKLAKLKLEKERLAKIAREKAKQDSITNVKLEKDRLAKLAREKAKNDSLLAIKNSKEKDEKIKQYNTVISNADLFYNNKDYNSAITKYILALDYKPNDDYANQRIVDSKRILKKMEQDDELKNIENMMNDFKDNEKSVKILSELAKKYHEGVTKEEYIINGEKTTRLIVVKKGIANEYRKIDHSWGGASFTKNGSTISENIFYLETRE